MLLSFFIIVILVNVKLYLFVVLVCIFLMSNDFEHTFKCLSDIYTYSMEKYLFRSFAHFLIELSFYC